MKIAWFQKLSRYIMQRFNVKTNRVETMMWKNSAYYYQYKLQKMCFPVAKQTEKTINRATMLIKIMYLEEK